MLDPLTLRFIFAFVFLLFIGFLSGIYLCRSTRMGRIKRFFTCCLPFGKKQVVITYDGLKPDTTCTFIFDLLNHSTDLIRRLVTPKVDYEEIVLDDTPVEVVEPPTPDVDTLKKAIKARDERVASEEESKASKLAVKLKPDEEPKRIEKDIDALCRYVWDHDADREEVIVRGFNMELTRHDLLKLHGHNWLNDELINFYFALLCQRSDASALYPSMYAFSTFFFSQLKRRGYAGVRRWTKDVNLFEHDLIFVPVHEAQNHWCLIVIDTRLKLLRFLDSMGSNSHEKLQLIQNYLSEESATKHNHHYRTTDYTMSEYEACPRQQNGYDCGVFMCQMAECIARDAAFQVYQRHIPSYRRSMMSEIVEKRIN